MNPLDTLCCDDFAARFSFIDNPSALRLALSRSRETLGIRDALASEALSEVDIREFVGQIMTGLVPGERFANDVALSALAVALESQPGAFADEFLRDLASVRLVELRHPSRVAQVCQAKRSRVPENVVRNFVLTESVGPTWELSSYATQTRIASTQDEQEFACATP